MDLADKNDHCVPQERTNQSQQIYNQFVGKLQWDGSLQNVYWLHDVFVRQNNELRDKHLIGEWWFVEGFQCETNDETW